MEQAALEVVSCPSLEDFKRGSKINYSGYYENNSWINIGDI